MPTWSKEDLIFRGPVVVTIMDQSLWVERSVAFGQLEDVRYYSTDPSYFFSGICICSAGVRMPISSSL